jgi:hypothetical protein
MSQWCANRAASCPIYHALILCVTNVCHSDTTRETRSVLQREDPNQRRTKFEQKQIVLEKVPDSICDEVSAYLTTGLWLCSLTFILQSSTEPFSAIHEYTRLN